MTYEWRTGRFPLVIEILFWLFLLTISLFYVVAHGLYRIGDGYFETAQVFYYNIFGGYMPPIESFFIFDSRWPFFRMLYPFLMALLAGLLNISLITAGTILSIIFGFGSLFYFSKIIGKISSNYLAKERLFRLLFGSSTTFIIYWTKISIDITILFFTLGFFYHLFCVRIDKDYQKNIFFVFLFLILSILTKELMILLFFPLIHVIGEKKNISTKRIVITEIILYLLGMLSYFYIFSEHLIESRPPFEFFYNRIFPINESNPILKVENIPEFIWIVLNWLFSVTVLIVIIWAIIFTSFSFILFMAYVMYKDKDTGWLNLRHVAHMLLKEYGSLFSWCFVYSFAIYLMLAAHIIERYLLPVTWAFPILTLAIVDISKTKIELDLVLIILIVINVLIAIARLIIIL